MTLTAQAEKQKKLTTAKLEADVMTGALAGHMQAFAKGVLSNPQAYNEHHAHKLRNAAQLARDAADLIDLERKK
jgi:cell division septum initiation protein DivIVA